MGAREDHIVIGGSARLAAASELRSDIVPACEGRDGADPGVGAGEAMRFHFNMETMEEERLLGPDVAYERKAYPCEFPWRPSLHVCSSDDNMLRDGFSDRLTLCISYSDINIKYFNLL